jgi:basic amino acid/polyamine antiporter, APA family
MGKIGSYKTGKKLTLKRDLGLFNATAAGVGIIVGAGIYVLIGAAAGLAGNMVWLSLLISAIVALFTGLSYAELSSLFPSDDGEYAYVKNAMNRPMAFIIGYLVVFAGIVTSAAVALGFANYFNFLFGLTNFILVAIVITLIFSAINYIGIKQSARLNLLFTFLEVSALLVIIFFSIKYFGKVDYFQTPGLEGVFSAASLIFFAFMGFESIIKLTEETKNPEKTIPLALMLSIGITTVIYVLLGIAAVSVVGWETLGVSKAPLTLIAQTLLGSKAGISLSIIALFSTGNTILISLLTTSRMMYGMGPDLPMFEFLGNVDRKTRTPYNAVIITGILSVLFIFFGKNIELVANVANFIIFVTFFLVNLAVIILRYKIKNLKRSFRIPFNIGNFPVIPLFGMITCILMLINLPLDVIGIGFLMVIIGFILYYMTSEPKTKLTRLYNLK